MTATLRVVLGDQLDRDSTLIAQCGEHDIVWMAEVPEESRHVASHRARSAYFLAAMRHFAEDVTQLGYAVEYHRLGQHEWQDLGAALAAALEKHRPDRVLVIRPGDLRVEAQLRQAASDSGVAIEIVEDAHFFCAIDDFKRWAKGRKQLRMEYFYREQRQRFGILMDGSAPCGGAWNFDKDNRGSFKQGPSFLEAPSVYPPDALTQSAIDDVQRYMADNPGSLSNFDWPVTPAQAEDALRDFVCNRLVAFGDFQDAMWRQEPWLYHSRLSAAMNLKLLNPRKVIAEVEAAYRNGHVAINAAEGFIRQILGWREYVRGLYYCFGNEYQQCNALEADQALPEFYWHGYTGMRCLAEAIGQTLEYGYAHHIQRLMVTGLFSLLLGVRPGEIHAWYLAVYVDAVEWVELPNTLGMSQYADGGLMASKPYIASGKYIERMSNYCDHCRYKPAKRTGAEACPFTVLYWDFLKRHQQRFSNHPRLALQCRNVARINDDEMNAIQARAIQIKQEIDTL